ncbi:MAG: hypothetical protein K6A65_01560 [Succinivibrionaceae bacterium]|nr:hypothetical protein [Succinivibrionaceae bacterium]
MTRLKSVQKNVRTPFPTLFRVAWQYGNVPYFIFLYCLGAYISRFGLVPRRRVLACLLLATLLLGLALEILIKELALPLPLNYFCWGMEKIPALAAAALLFLIFRNLGVERFRRAITFFSSSAFAVYLFHIGMLWPLIFREWFHDLRLYNHWWFPVTLLGNALAIYLAATLVDKVRVRLLERPLLPAFNRIASLVSRRLPYPGTGTVPAKGAISRRGSRVCQHGPDQGAGRDSFRELK